MILLQMRSFSIVVLFIYFYIFEIGTKMLTEALNDVYFKCMSVSLLICVLRIVHCGVVCVEM